MIGSADDGPPRGLDPVEDHELPQMTEEILQCVYSSLLSSYFHRQIALASTSVWNNILLVIDHCLLDDKCLFCFTLAHGPDLKGQRSPFQEAAFVSLFTGISYRKHRYSSRIVVSAELTLTGR